MNVNFWLSWTNLKQYVAQDEAILAELLNWTRIKAVPFTGIFWMGPNLDDRPYFWDSAKQHIRMKWALDAGLDIVVGTKCWPQYGARLGDEAVYLERQKAGLRWIGRELSLPRSQRSLHRSCERVLTNASLLSSEENFGRGFKTLGDFEPTAQDGLRGILKVGDPPGVVRDDLAELVKYEGQKLTYGHPYGSQDARSFANYAIASQYAELCLCAKSYGVSFASPGGPVARLRDIMPLPVGENLRPFAWGSNVVPLGVDASRGESTVTAAQFVELVRRFPEIQAEMPEAKELWAYIELDHAIPVMGEIAKLWK